MTARISTIALILLAIIAPLHADEPPRPNVILIMTDDQGIGDFGATGNKVIETPHIDAMAKESASLSTFYVSPVCSPTRACLMTGRYNYRTRCIDTYLGRSMMEPDEWTLAEALAGSGYTTGIFGKWHLGDNYPMRPQDQGFDEVLVHRGGGLAQPSEPRENNRRYTNPILFHNGKQVQTKGYCTDVYFDAAIEFIKESQQANKNFFVYLPTNAPHGPFHDVPEDLRKHYMTKDLASLIVGNRRGKRREAEIDKLARIAAMITNVDQNVGRLFRTLEASGLIENTMVIFLVDNGPNSMRYVGNRRGMKSYVNEGGIRAPLWIHWPARLEPGVASDQVAAHIDLMPTILDACDAKIPAAQQFDGRSLLPLLLGQKDKLPERSLVIQSHRGDKPVRYHHFMIRRGPWKLLHASGFGRESFSGKPKFELYNIEEDPREANNLVERKPEIFGELRAAYDRWFDDVSSTREDNYAPPRIVVGSEHENPSVLTRQDWRGGTWRKNSIGHWLLSVAEPGTFDIKLIYDASDEAETAELTVGGVRKTANVPAESDELTISGIELERGHTELHVHLAGDDGKRGVYQVEVSKR